MRGARTPGGLAVRPASVARSPALPGQQRDDLCGPFQAARVLLDAGVLEWDGEPVDQDLLAHRAGTVLPERPGSVPRGASSLAGYRLPLERGPASGTAAESLARAVEDASGGALACVALMGEWDGETVASLTLAAPEHGARLLANLRTGRLWGSRPPIGTLLAALDGEQPEGPPPDWDVGHFVELSRLVRGHGGALVLVADSYPVLGWEGHHLQPPDRVAAALLRGDGREGGVLAIVPAAEREAVRSMASGLGLEERLWDNGTRRLTA